MKTWKEVKKERMEMVGYRCEVCGAPKATTHLIGHHIVPRKNGKEFSVENCQIRCWTCEEMMHRFFIGGNDPKEKHRKEMKK